MNSLFPSPIARCLGALVVLAAPMSSPCHAQNYKEKPTYDTVKLTAGANPDGTLVKVEAGGNIQTKLGGVAAWVAHPPDVRLIYTAGNASLIIRAESDSDTTLLINLPDGTWIANDDGPNTGLNPYIRLDSPASGQYDIWVGTFAGGKYPPANLIISEITKEAAKEANQFAVVELENRTTKHPIRYRFRWGENAAWGNAVLLNPGRHQTHSFPYDKSGDRPPLPQISFEKGIGVDAGSATYNLEAYASKTRGDGKGYNFVVKSSETARDTIDLVKRTKAEEDASLKLSTAIMRILANDYKSGEELATQALKADPTSTRGYAIRGRAKQFAGDYDGGLRDFAHGLRLAPSDPELVVFRAQTFGRKKRYDRTIDEAGKALELDPFLVEALNARALAHYRMTNYDLAIADLRKAIKIEPGNWWTLGILGEAHIATNRAVIALDYLNQAIAIHQKDFELYAARAQAHQILGDAAKAALDRQKAVQLGMPPYFAVYYSADEALRALDNYQFGVLVTPQVLNRFNMQNFEIEPPFAGKAPPKLADELEELVTGEWSRHRALKFEATAGVDRFLAAARLTDEQRKAKSMELNWFYGPVTSPVARFRSGDDLGGLRVIGNLKLPGGRELTMIFALTYYPPTGEKVENGKVGMLFDGDNSRIQARLHGTGTFENDYLFQSYGANLQQGKLVMRPGYNLDETTGALTHEALTPSSLSTRCMHCHNKGFEPSEKLLDELKIQRSQSAADIANLEAVKKFLELAYVNGAGRIELKQLEKQMIKGGPNSLLPLDDLHKANRQYWLEIYPQYVEMRANPQRFIDPAPRGEGVKQPSKMKKK